MKIPTLLAGPILRRVEKDGLYIWIALSKPYDIEGKIFEIQLDSQGGFNYRNTSVITNTSMIRLGSNLYGYLVQVTPREGNFPEEVLMGYNLLLTSPSEKLDLENFQLLSKEHPRSIVYGNLRYPTFFIPRINKKILFGSCRKLHGKGHDALVSGDMKIGETHILLNKRPSALFLLGDQIYGDDVADPITPFIQKFGRELIGVEENISSLDERLETDHYRKSMYQVRGRKFIMEKFCSFTSANASNHLMTFGEFATMYLLSYSPEIWDVAMQDENFHSFSDLVKEDRYYFIFPQEMGYEDEFSTEFREHQQRYKEQLADLQRFKHSLPQIRRLMANIPTYMIFDDHEITDDYQLSREWQENVNRSLLAKHIIANGLAANWFFQGWGNAPEEFDSSFLTQMKKYMDSYDVQSPDYRVWQDQLFTFKKWSFVAPTNPKALFLDTRTLRSFPAGNGTLVGKVVKEMSSGPQLLNDEAWEIVTDQLRDSGWKKNSPLILISPSPFYGIRLIESFLHQYVMPLKLFRIPVRSKFDLEAWRFNGKAVHEFYRCINSWNPSKLIILSGDAHMASAVEAHVTFEDGKTRRIQQFTSSPVKNDSFSTLTQFFLKGLLRLYTWINGKTELHRSCDLGFQLRYSKEDSNDACLWEEKLHYQSLPSGSIVETNNNLGMLTYDEENVTLLQYEDSIFTEKKWR